MKEKREFSEEERKRIDEAWKRVGDKIGKSFSIGNNTIQRNTGNFGKKLEKSKKHLVKFHYFQYRPIS
jgi:translation initiation factor 2 beta subunit (eIF-2beta)/eIF-5